MKTVTIDPQHRIRIGAEQPFTKFWLIPDEEGYRLRRIPKLEAEPKPTLAQAKALIKKHSWKLTVGWAEMRKELREID